MRYLAMLVGFAMLGYVAQEYLLKAKPKKAALTKEELAAPVPPSPPPQLEEPPPVLDMQALQRIRTSTRDTNPAVRWEAVKLLISSQDPQANQYLYDILHRDTEEDLRTRAVGVLAQRSGQEVIGHLVQRLRDTSSRVRLASLNALSQIGDPSAAPHIAALTSDVEEGVRLAAIQTLNRLEEIRIQRARKAQEANQRAMKEYQEKRRAYEEAQRKRETQER